MNARGDSLSLARGRRLRQKSRTIFVWWLGLFAAAQLALVLALYFWHPTWTDSWQAHKWEQLRQRVAREPDRPLVVMLGSSRTDFAFKALNLDGLPGPGGKPWLAYNFGVPMVGPMHLGLYLDRMLRAGVKPRLVLVEFVPVLLNRARPGLISEESWTETAWLTASELRFLHRYWSHPNRQERVWLEARLAPWFAFRPYLLWSFINTWFPHAGWGAVLPDWRWETCPHDAGGFGLPSIPCPTTLDELESGWVGAWRRFDRSLKHLRPGRLPVQALRDLLARCRREGIAAALVFLPESGVYRSWYAPGGLDEARRLLRDLCREYGALAIDASDWIPDWQFGDGHHLQEVGARVFTDWLIASLRPLLDRLREEGRPPAAAAAGSP
jgi:hypothetical protein